MKPILLDIMLDGVYKGQLKYYGRGFPKLVDGKVIEVFNTKDIEAFVEEKKPSLKGKPYQVLFSEQRV